MKILERITFVFYLPVLLFSLSCKSAGEFQEYKLTVDSTQLGSQTSLGQVVVSVPKDWVLADSLVNAAAAVIVSDDRGAAAKPALVMYKPLTKSLMIGHLEVAGSPASLDFEQWTSGCRQIFQKMHVRSSFSEARLRVNGVRLVQLFSADSLGVHFRLLLDVQPPVVLDYLLRQSSLRTDLRAVESSTGTIRKG